jgi:alpha-1,2-mannosyltransferase
MEASFVLILAAWNMPSVDCDEVFNYFEPLHYLQYGTGLHPWEYDPENALRSYLYLGIHYLLALPFTFLPKPYVYRILRVIIALFSIYCQRKLALALKVPKRIQFLFYTTAGMIGANVRFLPQSFVMNFYVLAASSFLSFYKTGADSSLFYSLLFSGIAIFIGWPFISVMFLGFAMPYIIKYPNFLLNKNLYIYGICSLVLTIGVQCTVDYYFYKRLVFTFLNILSYNTSFGWDLTGNAVLYGVEPWNYYLKSCILNFNLVMPK